MRSNEFKSLEEMREYPYICAQKRPAPGRSGYYLYTEMHPSVKNLHEAASIIGGTIANLLEGVDNPDDEAFNAMMFRVYATAKTAYDENCQRRETEKNG